MESTEALEIQSCWNQLNARPQNSKTLALHDDVFTNTQSDWSANSKTALQCNSQDADICKDPNTQETIFSTSMSMLKNGLASVPLRTAANMVRSWLLTGVHADYEIQSTEYGKGHYGVVKKAIHRKTGVLAAIKILAKSDLNSKNDLDFIHREVTIMSEIDHPNCVEFYGAYESRTHVYIVMEPVTGGQLLERIVAKAHYSETAAAGVFLQIISAVHYLHQMGIVHRDLKPDNVLYATPADDSPVKLCDFGLGKLVNVSDLDAGRCRLWSRCGSPDYVAPEVLRRQGYGKECDVWSAGAILYVLLCGRPPFNQETVTSKFEHIRRGSYSFASSTWAGVSVEAKDLISKLLCVDCKVRLGYPQILDHAWVRRYLEGQLSEEAMEATQDLMRQWTLARKVRTVLCTCWALAHVMRVERQSEAVAADTPLCHFEDAKLHLASVRGDAGWEAELREAFNLLDRRRIGRVDAEDVQAALEAIRTDSEAPRVRSLLKRMDILQRGYVGFDEFCIMMGLPAKSDATHAAALDTHAAQAPGSDVASPRKSGSWKGLRVEVPNPNSSVESEADGSGTAAQAAEESGAVAAGEEGLELAEQERRWEVTEEELREVCDGMGVCRGGWIAAEDVRDVLQRFGMPLSDEEAALAVKVRREAAVCLQEDGEEDGRGVVGM